MSQFQPSNTLTFGHADAPHQVWAVFNLGCSETRDWFEAHFAELEKAVAAGRVQLHIQFWSKQKVPLVSGNVAHGYVDYTDPEAALDFTKAIFANLDALKAAPDVRAYLETTYGVHHNPQTELVDAQVGQAIAEAGITSVPTIVYDGQLYFDDTLEKVPAF
ncbi:MAG: DsbA family protein [Lactobacillus sp.]|jgi:predicted DsbA family dithiol-disulfide isomerase|nr:DsbA family protein [Lactobacillus sp.]MCI2031977.1 DsbA family protein [Lactobacillus sp.]